MSNLFIKDIISLEESHNSNTLTESNYKDAMDSFLSYAERKLTGYSVKEIDVLAKKAKAVDSEVKKREVLIRINDASKASKDKLVNSKTTDDQRKELRLQIQVLSELKNKVNAFKVTGEEEEKEPSERKTLNLDEL